MSVSASNAEVFIQSFCLYLMLYLRPLLSNVSASGVKVTFVLLTTRG